MLSKHHFQQYLSYIMMVSFIGGGNGGTWRKPQICSLRTLSRNVASSTPRQLPYDHDHDGP